MCVVSAFIFSISFARAAAGNDNDSATSSEGGKTVVSILSEGIGFITKFIKEFRLIPG